MVEDLLSHLHALGLSDQLIHGATLGLAAVALAILLLTGGPARLRFRSGKGGRRHSALYETYMTSPEWAAKRAQVKRRAGGRCEQCRKRPGVQVHHRTYARLGHEDLGDLRYLCMDCHQAQHGHSITGGRPVGKGCLRVVGVGVMALVAVGVVWWG